MKTRNGWIATTSSPFSSCVSSEFFFVTYKQKKSQTCTIGLFPFFIDPFPFKSSMEIPLFQWSQISKHPEWMPQINAWFDRFQVGVNL
jgi:hypothetical protein